MAYMNVQYYEILSNMVGCPGGQVRKTFAEVYIVLVLRISGMHSGHGG